MKTILSIINPVQQQNLIETIKLSLCRSKFGHAQMLRILTDSTVLNLAISPESESGRIYLNVVTVPSPEKIKLIQKQDSLDKNILQGVCSCLLTTTVIRYVAILRP